MERDAYENFSRGEAKGCPTNKYCSTKNQNKLSVFEGPSSTKTIDALFVDNS